VLEINKFHNDFSSIEIELLSKMQVVDLQPNKQTGRIPIGMRPTNRTFFYYYYYRAIIPTGFYKTKQSEKI